MVDTSDEWIVERTGIRERRVAAPDEALSDICLPAAREALEQAGVAAKDVDLLIVATITPDMVFPSTGALLADAARQPDAAAYDLSAGCTGFMYALAQALRDDRRRARRARARRRRRRALADHRLDATGRPACSSATARARSCSSTSRTAGSSASSSAPTAPAACTCTCRPAARGSRRRPRPSPAGDHFVHMNGREVFKFATRDARLVGEDMLDECGLTIDDVDVYIPHQANVRIIDHAAKRLGIDHDRVVINVDRYGNTSSGSIPLALADAVRGRPAQARRARADDGHGRRPHLGLGADGMDPERRPMSKIAFCFPGQGSVEVGMGRDIAEAVPEAMEVFERGSEASGLDLRAALLRGRRSRGSIETEVQQPALVATSLAVLAAIREQRHRARLRRRPLGRRVRRAGRRRGDDARRGDRARARARPGDGRGCPRAPRLDGRRSSASTTRSSRTSAGRSSACGRRTTTAPARSSSPGEDSAVEELSVEAQSLGARRAIKLKVSGAFHSPLVAQRRQAAASRRSSACRSARRRRRSCPR